MSRPIYATIRTLHLVLASLALPFLLIYGISAVQMSHEAWFHLTLSVTQQTIALTPGRDDARTVAREAMDRVPRIRGELQNIQVTPGGLTLRIVIPGTVHEVGYERATGTTRVKTTVGGVIAMFNRLHHAAGLMHQVTPVNLWGWTVVVVSVALLCLGVTGVWLWFLRRSERALGVVLLAVNLGFALTLIALIRRGGP